MNSDQPQYLNLVLNRAHSFLQKNLTNW